MKIRSIILGLLVMVVVTGCGSKTLQCDLMGGKTTLKYDDKKIISITATDSSGKTEKYTKEQLKETNDSIKQQKLTVKEYIEQGKAAITSMGGKCK